jgi:hypothetical protein
MSLESQDKIHAIRTTMLALEAKSVTQSKVTKRRLKIYQQQIADLVFYADFAQLIQDFVKEKK